MLTTIEQLAVAVLQGDTTAQHALIDAMMENGVGTVTVLPEHHNRIIVDKNRVRMILYVDNTNLGMDVGWDEKQITSDMMDWLEGRRQVLVLHGFRHVEIYQLPETPSVMPHDDSSRGQSQLGQPSTRCAFKEKLEGKSE